jgi:hypothetical protein
MGVACLLIFKHLQCDLGSTLRDYIFLLVLLIHIHLQQKRKGVLRVRMYITRNSKYVNGIEKQKDGSNGRCALPENGGVVSRNLCKCTHLHLTFPGKYYALY